jgi:glycine cleavage system H lipoate-binding protein
MRRAAQDNRKLRKGMTVPGKRSRIVFWQDRLKEQPSWKRPCLHHMKGRITFRSCTNDYRCGDCDFNQYFHDQYTVHAVVKPVNVLTVQGFRMPQGYYLHPGHTWVKLEEGKTVRIGIDDFALRVIGPPDKIEAPLVGKEVIRDRADISLQRGRNTAKLLSPVTGVVTDINPALREKSMTGNDPYSDGWIMRVHSADLRNDLKHLMIGSESKEMIAQEIDRLYGVIEEASGPLAADGGYLCDDIYGALPEIGWDRLTRLFLRN